MTYALLFLLRFYQGLPPGTEKHQIDIVLPMYIPVGISEEAFLAWAFIVGFIIFLRIFIWLAAIFAGFLAAGQ